MKMYLKMFVYGDYIHYSLSDIEGHDTPNQIFCKRINLNNFDFNRFNSYIKTANIYVDELIRKHNCKRTSELASDLHFWYNAIVGFVETKIELGFM